MEDMELKNVWKSYENQLEQARILNLQSWVLNLETKQSVQLMKAKTKLNRLARLKSWMVVAGIAWIAALLFLILNSLEWKKLFFVLSLSMIVLFTIVAVVVYIYHVRLIRSIDNSESIVEAQEKTAKLQSSSLQVVRILFLQMPFYTTWFYTWNQVTEPDPRFWLISFPITLFFVYLSLWLYRNINYKNINKRWFRFLFNGPEWTPIMKAMSFMQEIEEFKKNV